MRTFPYLFVKYRAICIKCPQGKVRGVDVGRGGNVDGNFCIEASCRNVLSLQKKKAFQVLSCWIFVAFYDGRLDYGMG